MCPQMEEPALCMSRTTVHSIKKRLLLALGDLLKAGPLVLPVHSGAWPTLTLIDPASCEACERMELDFHFLGICKNYVVFTFLQDLTLVSYCSRVVGWSLPVSSLL